MLLVLLTACTAPPTSAHGGGDPADTGGEAALPPAGPYGERSFAVDARANWVNTGLFLRAGQTAEITATGEWTVDGETVGPKGARALGVERDCAVGRFVARSGLRFEDTIACIGEGGTFTAETDDIVYVGMIASSDLGETYGARLVLDGALDVTVVSDGDTVPTVAAADIATYDFDAVASGWVELEGAHTLVTIAAAQAAADRETAADAIATIDAVYEAEADLRGALPYFGQPVRWYPDATITDFAYMLAGNPTRCDPALLTGNDDQRILRASNPRTDIWGFAHELGHSFSFADGFWVYQYVNVESWPNIFTLHALETLGRTEGQPNYDTYCDDAEAYLAGGEYPTLADDPFLQLCFLMEFEAAYGPGFYERFFTGILGRTNEDVGYDGTDASVWRFVKGEFDVAAGDDTRALFDTWRVPLE